MVIKGALITHKRLRKHASTLTYAALYNALDGWIVLRAPLRYCPFLAVWRSVCG